MLEELRKEESAAVMEHLVAEATATLTEEVARDETVKNRLTSGAVIYGTEAQQKSIPGIEDNAIFSERAIAALCTKYRLRFLSTSLFKGDIPYQAIHKVKELENRFPTPVREFKIIAPGERFRLKDSTKDPLLFADLGNGRYALVHQWGDDLSWQRKLLAFPIRNMESLAITCFMVGLLTAWLLPVGELFGISWHTPASYIFAHTFVISIVSGLLFMTSLVFGILSEKDFSENGWNSPYFN
ncbi:MAG: hypothetical protein AAGB22_16015 [Bacteroidota bacterium]